MNDHEKTKPALIAELDQLRARVVALEAAPASNLPVGREKALLLNHISDAVIITDLAYVVLSWNRAAAALYGWTAAEAIGQPLQVLVPTRYFSQSREETVAQFQATGAWEGEVVQRDRTGGSHYVHASVYLIRDRQGLPKRIMGINRDVTERREAAEARQSLLEQLELAISTSRLGVWIIDLQTDQIEWNDQLLQIYGLTREEFEADIHAWREMVHPDDVAGADQFFADLLAGKPVILEGRIRRKSGETRHLNIAATPIYNQQNELVKLIGINQDVTARKQAEQLQEQMAARLQQHADQLQMVMDSVPEGVLVLDAEGRIVLINPSAERDLAILTDQEMKTGRVLHQVGGLSLTELLEEPPQGLWHQLTSHNQSYELIAKALPAVDDDAGWLIVIRDVTSEREIQRRIQQQEQLASVGQLAAGIAHDFNNILAVISLYTELTLEESPLPPPTRKRFTTILKQTERASDLIQQILDFGRRSVMERLPLDLTPFVKELVKLLKRTLPETITIMHHYPDDEVRVNADPTRLQQVVMNLVFNARDAMTDGGRLEISLHRLSNDGNDGLPLSLRQRYQRNPARSDWACLSIRDSGMGIPADVLAHIFEPFYTTKEGGKGTGLGLAQVFGIVKQHDGEIDVSTAQEQGTRFDIYLPLLDAPSTAQVTPSSSALPLGDGALILIVEDDPEMLKVMQAALEELHYRTRSTHNGWEALAQLKVLGDEIALVICDLVMPEMGGKQLLEALRQMGSTTPVVIVTGHPMEDEKETIMALGAAAWLNKPPRLEKLARVVYQTLHDAGLG